MDAQGGRGRPVDSSVMNLTQVGVVLPALLIALASLPAQADLAVSTTASSTPPPAGCRGRPGRRVQPRAARLQSPAPLVRQSRRGATRPIDPVDDWRRLPAGDVEDLVQETDVPALFTWTAGRPPRQWGPWVATSCLNP